MVSHTTVVLLVIVLTYSVSASVVFPYTIVLPHYNITWFDSSPVPNIYVVLPNATQPSLLLSLDIVHNWVEYQAPGDIYVYNTGNEFAQKFKKEAIMIQNITAPSRFDAVEIQEKNAQGLSFSATLSNGANVLINYTANLDSILSLPIPRKALDVNCTYANRFEFNCSCEAEHKIPTHSLKFTVQVTNWTFAPLQPNMNNSILAETLSLIGDFNLDYYLNLKDTSELLHFDVCDVGYTIFNFTGGALSKISLFSNFFADGTPTQISSFLNSASFDQQRPLQI
eukprot:TRINITY_DN11113_c0_g1_i1.p1 TRINITY_DN11113_c0_g1~~TRINITY_DN11113_c0_g1_i1.p1  ORF type:complete len:291 (-),score=36.58 TRINITY_DN11113_c0_g1_i1:144-989(-)